MPIRILHVVDSLQQGGLENGLVNVIQGLTPPSFEHIVCAVRSLGPNADRLPGDRVPIVFLDKDASGSRFQVRPLVRVIRKFRPAVVHSRNWGAVEAVVAGRWVRSCALIHSEHGILTHGVVEEPWRRRRFRRLAYELADRVVSVSYRLRDMLAERTGYPARNITVIHNGVDTRRFSPDSSARAQVRSELGLAEDEFCIGCVANFSPVKDHLTLLRAVQKVAEECRSWRLLLIGQGPERPHLESFIDSDPKIASRVQFLGPSRRVHELLRAFDAFVLPSISEGISNSLLEAMAAGVPVLATSTGGNPEVIEGESGILFPVGGVRELAEQLACLHRFPVHRAELAGAALRRVSQCFSLEAMIDQYAALYRGVAWQALSKGVPAEA